MHEEIYAQTPRATKDIDIILIVEALSSDFAAKFWEFVKTAGYRQRNKGTGNGNAGMNITGSRNREIRISRIR